MYYGSKILKYFIRVLKQYFNDKKKIDNSYFLLANVLCIKKIYEFILLIELFYNIFVKKRFLMKKSSL